MNIIKKFFAHNWFAIIYFNFRMLPLRQAIRLPFDFYHKVRFESLKGSVDIVTSQPLYRGMIKIGGRGSDIFPRVESVLKIDGRVVFGVRNEIGMGTSLVVERGAKCELSDSVRIGSMCRLYCQRSIKIGRDVGVSWESQIFDTNFHFMESVADKTIVAKTSPVVIGSRCWIGNRVTIMKGCRVAADTIVTSNSLCNKDYTQLPSHTIIGGSPAKVIKQGFRRLSPDEEREYVSKSNE